MSDDAINERDELEDEYEDEDYDDDIADEIAPEGNRILGARARAVVEHVTRNVAEEPDAVEIGSRGGGRRRRRLCRPSAQSRSLRRRKSP